MQEDCHFMERLLSKNFKKRVARTCLPPVLFVLVNLLYFTCKKRFHIQGQQLQEGSAVFVFWHGELLMLPFAYKKYKKDHSIDLMISEHQDGEMAAKFAKYLGFGTIRGSSTRGGIKAMKAAFSSLAKHKDIGITPDGPKGPRHSIASGAIVLAQKKSLPIVALNYRASRAWRLKSWDSFAVPKPFSRLDFYFSEPFYVDDCNMQEAKEKITERLMTHAF